MLEALIPYKGIDTLLNSTVSKMEGNTVTVKSAGGETVIEADSVILCVGYKSKSTLYDQLQDKMADLHLVGDARNVANIMYAIWDAYEVASGL